ncbi:MAG: DUF2202 domain-containing protein [Austwickia sp.]|nr:MAG: DUF2202 domain-containing protein [Austwickia sp.]
MVPRRRTKLGRPAQLGAATLAGVALAATLAGPASAGTQTPGPGTGRPTNCPVATASPSAGSSATPGTGTSTGVPTATLSQETKDGLAFSREEERMARDLYAALAAVHNGARPMSMITTSEQRHFDAIGTLLQRYGLADPSAGKTAGTYAFPEIQKLYDDWFSRGKVSVQAAAQVGVELEQRDIADLQKLAAQPAPDDIKAVYANLLQGSQNHLAAFQRAASGSGGGMGPGAGAGQGPGQRGPGQRGPGMGRMAS